MNKLHILLITTFIMATQSVAQSNTQMNAPVVKTANGMLEGKYESGIRTFKGIPFAAPPVGKLRWKEPQPVQNWDGVRKADKFGPRAMQRPVFGDMNFRSNGMSEDCLYLNVWTPAISGAERLPVLVYFFGGGFIAGDGSEPRYDGESMARKGIVAVTVNFRLNVFGFFTHPELTAESSHRASGNYGLMDQSEALRWVHKNINAFGGDSLQVTIAGESAGSFSVCAQMASPLSKNLIARAIGESGSLLGLQPLPSLAQAEKLGVAFADSMGARTLASLREMPAAQVLEATGKSSSPRFSAITDGYFIPKSPMQIYTAGEQAKIPLLAGWNSEENSYRSILGQEKPTKENYIKAVQKLYGKRAAEVLNVYAAENDAQVEQVATDMASDRFIGFATWKWTDLQSKTGGKDVYRYLYLRPRPAMRPEMGDAVAGLAGGVMKPGPVKLPPARGAVHSAEIEYAMGNLPTNRVYDWQPDDYRVSEIMQSYFVNFIKTGNPNGLGLPAWPSATGSKNIQVMHIDVHTRVEPEKNRHRYLLLDQFEN